MREVPDFNKDRWREFISSQEALFRSSVFDHLANYFEDNLYRDDRASGAMPVISPTDFNCRDLNIIQDLPAGYDMPCLITDGRPEKGYLFFCAQDPLRNWQKHAALTVSTPFGIDNARFRNSYKNYGAFWELILRFVKAGYGVWVTDARKVWTPDYGRADALVPVFAGVLEREIELVDPVKIFAFGGQAYRSFVKTSAFERVIGVQHPSYRAKASWKYEGATREYPDSPQGRLEATVDRYIRAMET